MLMPVFLLSGDSMGKLFDLTGKRFGRLSVIRQNGRSKHGHAMWLCVCNCGRETTCHGNNLRQGHTRSCGCLAREDRDYMSKEKHHNWKGGRFNSSRGYMLINDPVHPNTNKAGYVLEHVKVMSEHLGRPLTKDETVHHKNGIRNDNRIENLELWSSSHPSGQRVSDKVAWAKEILRQYEPEALN